MTPIVLLAAYATGISMVHFLAPWTVTGHGMIFGIFLLAWLCLHRTRWGWMPFLGMLLSTGFLHASLSLEPPHADNHVSRFADTATLILEGKILTIEKRPMGGHRLLVEMHRVLQEEGSTKVSGDTLVYVNEGELTVRPGQIVRWRSLLRRPFSFGNPGEFNYPLYLAARGVHTTSFLNHAEDILAIVNHPDKQNESLENRRLDLAAWINRQVPEDVAGLVQSLLLGMRGGISDGQRQFLAESGVAHLFAISGLHFGLLVLLLYKIGKWFYTRSCRLILWCPPKRSLPLLMIVPLAAYLFLTGCAWSAQRAFFMVAIVAILFAKGRRTQPFALLATAAFCLLLLNPLALFQPGFQLSFSGVAGIMVWVPAWQRPFAGCAKLVRWPLTMLLTTIAATLATAPVVLWHFHQLAPASLVTNLVAIPLIAWGAVPLGLSSIVLLPISIPLANWSLSLSAGLVSFAISLVTRLCEWPKLAAIPLYLTISELIMLTGGLIILLPLGSGRSRLCFRSAILLTALGVAWFIKPQVPDFQITALSVGQGDSTLVSLAGDRHFLIDGGGLPGSSIDTGEQLVAPALGRMGIKRLQGVVLTHNHPDHSSGLTFILRRFPVDTFYLAADPADLSSELREILQRQSVPVRRISQGWTPLQTSGNQALSLFAPAQNSRDINERSIAVFAGEGDDGVLLTADLGKHGLQQLIDSGLPGRVSLLKLPHHGSRHAYPGLYLERMQPSKAFVSAGRGNTYGFPHQESVEACASRKIPLFSTDRQGMLTFRLHNGQWQTDRGRLYN